MPRRARPSRWIRAGWALALAGSGLSCGDSGTPPPEPRIVEGVDLDLLFAAPSAAEVAAIQAEWEGRSPVAEGVTIEKDTVVAAGALQVRVRIVSHDVGGVQHYGAMLTSLDLPPSAPVLVYAHGGDGGASAEEALALFPFLGTLGTGAVWVIPSFRSESLRFDGSTWTSGGSPSPWDRDVDDALALIEVTLALEPAADEDRIGVLGLSRGAGVGLLMGARDPRIGRIVEFFGPTDFFDEYVQNVVEEALRGSPRNLPGLGFLDETLIQPLKNGELTIAQVRPELIRRSAVLHAERLPSLQIHHGTADVVVEVSQAESLIAAMEALGRTEPDFQSFLYEGGGHNPLSLSGSVDRTVDFLSVLAEGGG